MKKLAIFLVGLIAGILGTVACTTIHEEYNYYKWLKVQHDFNVEYIDALECNDSIRLDSLRQCFLLKTGTAIF